MARERLLSTLDESEHNFKNILHNGLEQIATMQNLSQNELEQIAKMRRIKKLQKYVKRRNINCSSKSEQSLAELYKSKFNNTEIEESKKIFNELRNKFSNQK